MTRVLFLSASLALALAVGFESTARADVVPPDVDACSGKAVGAACKIDDSAGTCIKTKCSKLDYAGWDRDASSSPPTIEYDCVTCAVGTAPAPSDGGTAPTSTPAKSDGGCSFGVARRAGPFALAAIPGVVLALVRRRRRR